MNNSLPLELQHKSYIDSLSPEQCFRLSQIKRFAELLVGDPTFRQTLQTHYKSPQVVAEKYGLQINIDDLRSYWHAQYIPDRKTLNEKKHSPLTIEWDTHLDCIRQHRDGLKYQESITSDNEAFALWRQRQVGRCDDTLMASASGITHPSFAFELSDGCTVGCWFCGIAAEKYQGYFPYTDDNRRLWNDILHTLVENFGVNTLKTAFCYWATDPSDNPDYDHFIRDFHAVTQFVPQTTTARPLKDVVLTRKILALYDQYKCVFNRFSITTLAQLRDVHTTFTPQELFGTELVMQHKQALTAACSKSPSGHAREKIKQLETRGKRISHIKKNLKLNDAHTTIACVSGFLINLVKKTIRLVSPRAVSDLYPLGYKVHGTKSFTDREDFQSAMCQLVDTHMINRLPVIQSVVFNPGVNVTLSQSGFELSSQLRSAKVNTYQDSHKIGAYLVALDNKHKSYKTVLKELVELGCNVFSVCAILQHLYQQGFLADE